MLILQLFEKIAFILKVSKKQYIFLKPNNPYNFQKYT